MCSIVSCVDLIGLPLLLLGRFLAALPGVQMLSNIVRGQAIFICAYFTDMDQQKCAGFVHESEFFEVVFESHMLISTGRYMDVHPSFQSWRPIHRVYPNGTGSQCIRSSSYESRGTSVAFFLEGTEEKRDVPSRWVPQAHFPNKAIDPVPKKRHTNMKVNRLLSFVLSGLNRKSLAKSSTRPV